jgi:hypothetical protein
VSSTTAEAGLFLVLRVQDPDGRDVTFPGALDPHGAVAFGWLRASLRATDPELSEPHRPWYRFTKAEPLTPGEPVDVEVEIWPTSVRIPAGYRLGPTVLGRDFTFDGPGPWPHSYGVDMRGNGIFVHTIDRAGPLFGGTTTIHGGSVLLPVVR